MKEILCDNLKVRIFETRSLMGAAAAKDLCEMVHELLKQKEYVNIIFASAPSQNEFLAELKEKKIEWNRINAFHLDEYVGLPKDASQGFGNFLKERLFHHVSPREAHYLDGNAADLELECERYAELLRRYPADIVCLGIGENAHLAFNDPHAANFNDPKTVKVVDLDEKCRMQQVNDKCFKNIIQVPVHALTITIPALFKAHYAFAVVPGEQKANAVYHTLKSHIKENYPSTILRRHKNAILYIDEKSAAKLS